MQKLVFGIAGEIASGKGTFAKYLVSEHSAGSHRFSTMLRDILTRLYLPHSRDNMQRLSTTLRKTFGEESLAKVMAEDVKNDAHEIIAIDGIRRLADLKYLKENPGFKLVYIEADMEKRYDRIIGRGENPDDAKKTFEEFQKDHERETETQIKDLKNYADVVIDNNGDFPEFYSQIDKLIKG